MFSSRLLTKNLPLRIVHCCFFAGNKLPADHLRKILDSFAQKQIDQKEKQLSRPLTPIEKLKLLIDTDPRATITKCFNIMEDASNSFEDRVEAFKFLATNAFKHRPALPEEAERMKNFYHSIQSNCSITSPKFR